jgi:hypothetical protein
MSNQLIIKDMHARHRALTQPVAGAYYEAATVCLGRHHSPPVEMTLSDNGTESQAAVTWDVPDSRVLAAWANTTDATEAGAYGCVIAGVELLRGLFAVRRAETGTGADYYVGPKESAEDDLESCLRLEVSGLSDGNAKEVNRRLVLKVQQAHDGRSSLPALAGVVGFSARLLLVQDVPEES